MRKGRIFIISGPSGSGKTTLHKKLLLSKQLKGLLIKSISATTRPRRTAERHGRDYLFLGKEEFLRKKARGYFLEWQKVFDNYYGTPRRSVEKLLRRGRNVLLCIDVKGAKVASRRYPDTVKIFIQAPSLAVLRKRLSQRGSETKKDLVLRLAIARREMREAKHYDHIVINDKFANAVRKLELIITKELLKKGPERVGHGISTD